MSKVDNVNNKSAAFGKSAALGYFEIKVVTS